MSCSNQVVRFALSDASGVTGFSVTSKVEAGAQGLLARGCTKVGGVCTDYSGNIYVSDMDQHCILKIDEGGRISNFAGLPGTSGNNDIANIPQRVPCNDTQVAGVMQGDGARFYMPMGLCCDKSNRIYVADYGNNQIRVIDSGYVSVVAGLSGKGALFVDGVGHIARFNGPKGIDVDASGILYVADLGNHALRKITPSGSVLTISGILGAAASGDGHNARANKYTAQLNSPWSVACDAEGNVYVLDTGNHKIKKITPNGWIYTHSGSGVEGHSLGTAGTTPATCQSFTCTYGDLTYCKIDKSGNLYVVDRLESWTRLLKVNYNGVPAQIADFHATAYVDCPIGVAVSPGQKLFVTFSDFETGMSSSSSSSSQSSASSASSSSSSSSMDSSSSSSD